MQIGDLVLVPSPEPKDLWQHEFSGVICDIKPDGVITVEDGDSACWDVDESRCTAL